jgi:transposase-like protein
MARYASAPFSRGGADNRSDSGEQIGPPVRSESAGDLAVCCGRPQFPFAAVARHLRCVTYSCRACDHVFSLSLRDVELLLAERGIVVSYETVRRWCRKFGQSFANRLRRSRPRPGDKWFLDEVFIRIQGVQHYLWRAVDQDGVVLHILVQSRRDAKAAKRFFRQLLKGLQYVPRVIVTDKLRSYGVAQRHLLPGVEHRQSRYLNNRAENSHRPTRRRRQPVPIVRSGPTLSIPGSKRPAPDMQHDGRGTTDLGYTLSARS